VHPLGQGPKGLSHHDAVGTRPGGTLSVLFVIDSLGSGGAERSLQEALPLLVDEGVTPLVVCLVRRDEGFVQEVLDAGFDVRFLRSRGLVGRVRELRRLIRALRPDIVHTTLFDSDIAGRLAGMRGTPAVVTSLVNTPYPAIRLEDPNVRAVRLRAARAIDGWTARHLTRHFHAVSHAVKAAAERSLRIPPQRITVIERGRDPARLGTPSPARRRTARDRLGLHADAEVLVNVGRQEFQKGQRYLLEAIGQLVASHPGIVLLVAGRRGNASADLEMLSSAPALRGRVRFLGHRDDVPEVLAAADLFVFPSLYEGLGGAQLEAMALGLPLVSSDLEAVREVVEPGGNALLVPPKEPARLASAISTLLRDEQKRSSFGKRSREIFLGRFTLDRIASRMRGMYEEVLGRGP
jgi:glycosyltransferase involved in cell wall biosynthesis